MRSNTGGAPTAVFISKRFGEWNRKNIGKFPRDNKKERIVCDTLLFYIEVSPASCQKATALAAATFRESTPWDMGILTV